jgi:ATPase subunit of ABC transporter with duplicated ATPase domains
MTLPLAPDLRFPGPLVSLEKVSFRYKPKGVDVLQDLDLTIHVGDRVGIVGLNGCGKTTLINIVTDLSKPTKGSVTRHSRLRLGYYSQHSVEYLKELGNLEASRTALSTILEDAGDEMLEGDARGLLGSLGLPGRTASDISIAKLSGGQLV